MAGEGAAERRSPGSPQGGAQGGTRAGGWSSGSDARDGAVDPIQLSQGIRAVDHEGRVTANHLFSDRLVDVSAGETAEVIVELRRK